MDDFEKLLCECRGALERFVKFRLPSEFDADDVLQEVYMAAHGKFDSLNDKSMFKAWIIGIARHKCDDYFRKRAKNMEIPIDEVGESALSYGRMGITEINTVRRTLSALASRDKEILYLYFFCEMPQADIAKKLGIPVGTVKSRLHTAKENFKEKYPYPPATHRNAEQNVMKGVNNMKKLPEIMPEYKIVRSEKEPFAVVWEELMGWFLVPKPGEKLSWAEYTPDNQINASYDMSVTGNAFVHGIRGVKIDVRHNLFKSKPDRYLDMYFIAQLTDTHCRFLAESHYSKDRDARMYFTFLDDEVFEDIGSFTANWGFGENNCGNETHLAAKGDITRDGSIITSKDKPFLLDIVGRYTVTIAGKSYDTVCVMDIETYNSGVVSEQYLDKNGRTVLWRRFNRDDWAFDRYKQKWSEKLPNNERLTVNGETYVHWYDCITDYIL